MPTTKLNRWMQCALFAALTAIFSQIAIPIGPVPINLATLSVFLSGALLGSRYGFLSQLLYVLMGAVGMPVFSAFQGGVAVVVGPRGGYIVGYVLGAWVIGLLVEQFGRAPSALVLSMLMGMLTYEVLGTLWFMQVTATELSAALAICVAPFLPGDAAKIACAMVLVRRLYPVLQHSGADVS